MEVIVSNGYEVTIGKGVFKSLSAFLGKTSYSSCFILCDENTMTYCLPELITTCPLLVGSEVIEIESGEESKSLEICASIWEAFIESGVDKKALLINLGGGVVSDLGGFCASIYKRGIDYINLPTSLLAMADASVGGKTGIDFHSVKNAIGTFNQPKGVFIHTGFLKTLPEQHFQNGLAEVYKMALISDLKFWEALKEGMKIESLVEKSILLKNRIVLKDPLDKGIRNILNFGHSIGHALEAVYMDAAEPLLHGEAVLCGMVMESHIAYQKKMIPKKTLDEITQVLSSSFALRNLDAVSFDQLAGFLRNDKKNSGNKFRFALINQIGSCQYDIEVSENQVKRSLAFYKDLLK